MIRILRLVRKELLADKRFAKYLIYALGEIILVVIGILIALAINNWNEQRKLDTVQYLTLINLLKEVERSRSNLDQLKNVKSEIGSTIEFLLSKTGADGEFEGEYNLDNLLGIVLIRAGSCSLLPGS